MLDQGCEILGLHGVNDIEEVLSLGHIGLGLLCSEKLCEGGLDHHIVDEADDAQLIIMRYADRAELGVGDQVLPPCEDLFEIILGYLLLRGEIVAA